jgi:excisionase family DNA binding protein
MVSPALYTTKSAQERIGCAHTTLYDLIAKGKLAAVKLGAKTMITAESLDALIASLPRANIRAKPTPTRTGA